MKRKTGLVAALLFMMMVITAGCGSDKKTEKTEAVTVTTEARSIEAIEEKTTEEITTEQKTTEEKTTEEKATEEKTIEEETTEARRELPEGPEYDTSGVVKISDVDPDIEQEIRYYSDFNFVGERIEGYEEPIALLTREAATSLKDANDDLKEKGYRLKIYDAYRPQDAVDNFVEWSQDENDTGMKEYFYPELDKSVLFSQGYIARHSAHSRGSTVDITLVDAETGSDIDMGGTFDYFGERSHADYSGITEEQYSNRMILRDAMTAHGFKPYNGEWWHFSLINEPYPNIYFNFPVNSAYLE